MRTSNPAISEKMFRNLAPSAGGGAMTVQGAVNKTFLLLLLVLLPAGWIWSRFYGNIETFDPTLWIAGGAIGGLIVAIATIFKKTWAPVTAPIYALLEGLVLGGLSALFELQFPGIVIQAVGLTFGTMLVMLVAYTGGLIKVTHKFRMGLLMATGSIFLVYLATFVLGFFGVSVPLIHSNGWVGILFSLFVVGIAALNLVLDFDLIDQGARHGAPKYMEWYGAFALMVTLIWLYIEILRLLAKLRSR